MIINSMTHPLMFESVWFDKYKYDEAEKKFEEEVARQQKVGSVKETMEKVVAQPPKSEEKIVAQPPETEKKFVAQPLMSETVWFDKCKYDEAEKKSEEKAAQQRKVVCICETVEKPKSSLAEEIANARQHILNTLQSGDFQVKSAGGNKDYEALFKQCEQLKTENKELRKIHEHLWSQLQELRDRVTALENKCTVESKETKVVKEEKTVNSVVNNHSGGGGGDDDIDLFGSDEEDEAANQLREERLKAYEKKKSQKAPPVAKSSVILDIKPWDDETDMKEMEVRVRQIDCEGLKWGACKLVPLAYGIKKLQIVCVVEDDKVSIDWLQETIQDTIDDLVQSVDIAAFNKL